MKNQILGTTALVVAAATPFAAFAQSAAPTSSDANLSPLQAA